MSALSVLFLEIEKHAIYRAHATLVWEARQEVEEILQRDSRLISAAKGRGMLSELANVEEGAVLVCALHDQVDALSEKLNLSQIENCTLRKEIQRSQETQKEAGNE